MLKIHCLRGMLWKNVLHRKVRRFRDDSDAFAFSAVGFNTLTHLQKSILVAKTGAEVGVVRAA